MQAARSFKVALIIALVAPLFGVSPAQAKKPPCVDLAIGISAVDAQLDQAGIQFEDLGAFLAALNDLGFFGQLNAAFAASIGSDFKDLKTFYKSVQKCGLVPHLIDQIKD